jgi:exopolysaccharide biosynthesis polyprenyl glycosylphosphotransferase
LIRRHELAFQMTLMVLDGAMAVGLALLISTLRFGSGQVLQTLDWALPDPVASLIVFSFAWVTCLWANGLYRTRARWTLRREIGDVVRATLAFGIGTFAFLYISKVPGVSRLLLVSLFPSMGAAALATRLGLRVLLERLRRRGRNTRFVLVIGGGRPAQEFADLIEAHVELGLKIVGHLTGSRKSSGMDLTRPVLGTVDDLATILHSEIVDEVAICLPFSEQATIERVTRLCQEEGKTVRIPVAVLERTLSLGKFEELDGLPIISLSSGSDRILALAAKRGLDVAGSALLLIVLSPVFLLLALLVRLDTPGPAFFRQERLGLHGRPFQVIKFRSMASDAEERLEDLQAHNLIRGHAFKMESDPRVTRVGRLLRRSSLDELPQLLNVLRGEMSLVGPRPPLPNEVAKYDVWHRRRLSMKPGMTGLWQIGARRTTDFDHWVEKDLEYIDRWSLWLDLKIIARTVPAVLMGGGR